MTAAPFLDSNILIYAYSVDRRSAAAQALCEHPHTLSVQSLNEFANVARRKLRFDWDRIVERLQSIVELAEPIVPLTLELHQTGIVLADRYKLQVHDGTVLAAALHSGCNIVYSEDMHDGLTIEDRLTILNPFR